jgi:hypothetical protein
MRTLKERPHHEPKESVISWTDQKPPAGDVLLSARITTYRPGYNHRDKAIHFEIDKLEDGTYRATVGNLFGSQEVIRHRSLEAVLRAIDRLHDRRGEASSSQ